MDVAITKISKNGQVVIPADIRREAAIEPSTKFIVFAQNGNILLKKIRKEALADDMKLIEKIERSEQYIKQGKVIKAHTHMREEDIDDLLMM